jgi:hypothetical protein
MKVNFNDLIKAVSSNMKTLSFGCEKVAVVRNILQFFDANSNA